MAPTATVQTDLRRGDKVLHKSRPAVVAYIAYEGSEHFREPWANVMLADATMVCAAIKDLECPDRIDDNRQCAFPFNN